MIAVVHALTVRTHSVFQRSGLMLSLLTGSSGLITANPDHTRRLQQSAGAGVNLRV